MVTACSVLAVSPATLPCHLSSVSSQRAFGSSRTNCPLLSSSHIPSRKFLLKTGAERSSKDLEFKMLSPTIDYPSPIEATAAGLQDRNDSAIGKEKFLLDNGDRKMEVEGQPRVSMQSRSRRKKVFFLDVAPLCYKGKKPQPSAFLEWMRMLFLNVADKDPIIAVMDGERGNEYRRNLLPTYKANRNNFVPLSSLKHRQTWIGDDADLREAFPCIRTFLNECNVPVMKVEDAEADDVVASLAEQAIQKGMRVVIASPDKDFKQMLCENVQLAIPLTDLGRWSFYTYKQYVTQHDCDPGIELGLRCMLGDQCDSIPGLSDLAPGFGRNTALKLMKKHGSLENLLKASSTRTVGKPYIQNALTKHALFLWRNLELLTLRRDLPVVFKDEWCFARENTNDMQALLTLKEKLNYLQSQRAAEVGMGTRVSCVDQKAKRQLTASKNPKWS